MLWIESGWKRSWRVAIGKTNFLSRNLLFCFSETRLQCFFLAVRSISHRWTGSIIVMVMHRLRIGLERRERAVSLHVRCNASLFIETCQGFIAIRCVENNQGYLLTVHVLYAMKLVFLLPDCNVVYRFEIWVLRVGETTRREGIERKNGSFDRKIIAYKSS